MSKKSKWGLELYLLLNTIHFASVNFELLHPGGLLTSNKSNQQFSLPTTLVTTQAAIVKSPSYYNRRSCVQVKNDLVRGAWSFTVRGSLPSPGSITRVPPPTCSDYLKHKKRKSKKQKKTQIMSKNCFAFQHKNRKDDNGHKYTTDANNVLESFKGLQTVLIVEGFT